MDKECIIVQLIKGAICVKQLEMKNWRGKNILVLQSLIDLQFHTITIKNYVESKILNQRNQSAHSNVALCEYFLQIKKFIWI